MREDEAYLEIAQRFIESCDEHINNGINIQEVIGFKAYHAFESLGGSLNSHLGHAIPRGHVKKINAFVINSGNCRQVNRHNIAGIAIFLMSMRNKFLYPYLVGTTFKTPKDQISMTDAKKVVSKIKGIMRQVERLI